LNWASLATSFAAQARHLLAMAVQSHCLASTRRGWSSSGFVCGGRKHHFSQMEFVETGMSDELGYKTAAELRAAYPTFFWTTVSPFIGEALRNLRWSMRCDTGISRKPYPAEGPRLKPVGLRSGGRPPAGE